MTRLWNLFLTACLLQRLLFSAASVQQARNDDASGHGTSTCASCQNARARQRSPQELQRDKLRFEQDKILSKLRLQRPPNVHVFMSDLPSPLLRRFKADNEEFEKNDANADSFYVRTHYATDAHQEGVSDGTSRPWREEDEEKEDPLTAKTKGVYIFSQQPSTGDTHTFNCPDSGGRIGGCLEFKLNNELFSRHITSASLWVYKTVSDDSEGNRTLEVTEIQRTHQHNAAYSELWVTDIPVIDKANGWMEIDLTDHVTRWHRRPPNGESAIWTRRLRVVCNGCSNSAHAPIALNTSRQPFLEVKLGKKVVSRSSLGRKRRNSNECSPHLYSNCCLKPFYVNFTEIGWNSWILQPPGYYANYCTGSCRMTSTTSYNSIIRNVGNTKEARGEVVDQELMPCCAPTKMMSLSLLYAFSPGEIMKKTLDNMIVESCGC